MQQKGSIVCLKCRAVSGKGCEENISCGRDGTERAALGKLDGASSLSHGSNNGFWPPWMDQV